MEREGRNPEDGSTGCEEVGGAGLGEWPAGVSQKIEQTLSMGPFRFPKKLRSYIKEGDRVFCAER